MVLALVTAAESIRLYPRKSPIPRETVESARKLLAEYFETGERALTLRIVRDGFIHGSERLSMGAAGVSDFVTESRDHGLSELVILSGCSTQELLAFLRTAGDDTESACARGGLVAPLVAYEHHMRVDGGGYPARDGGEMHPYSRIVATANRYENLTNPAGGSPPVSPDRAVMQVLSEAGTALELVFVRLLATALGVFSVRCVVWLSSHVVAVVAAPGAGPLRPLVRVAFDERGLELEESVEFDLSSSDEHIVEAFGADFLRLVGAEKP